MVNAGPDPKVDFVVAGAQKSGTRALSSFLFQHPEIGLVKPPRREAHFFDQDKPRSRDGDFNEYHELFSEDSLNRVAGDVTPIYVFNPAVWPRVKAYNRDMKVIVLLRDPVERAYSQWAMEFQKAKEHRNFGSALLNEARLFLSGHRHSPVFSYMQRGFYSGQIKRLYKHFPPDQCLILKSDDLRNRHDTTLKTIYRFLGVTEITPPEQKSVHTRKYDPMPKLLATLLRGLFTPDIRRLEKLLDWNCKDWRLL
ncbi:Sulfotransferase domain protein [Shimia sp. SK013]|uniref:sulfotransferase domain-containing protein n=1 Tax=Shimia sp. SK013 TaxID=1389006 RepID=UPI0006B53708|nr:sulfotransferase domain-containing protein [Shimia sp. SK013]KPA19789.1 Sulfotransferase domain protein [Shimia sp. SK013]